MDASGGVAGVGLVLILLLGPWRLRDQASREWVGSGLRDFFSDSARATAPACVARALEAVPIAEITASCGAVHRRARLMNYSDAAAPCKES
jgi:hypothetical protein